MANLILRHENNEFEYRFTRRRYGNTTYTWAEVNHGGDFYSLGDPWPCITPKKSELIEATLQLIEQRWSNQIVPIAAN